MQSVEKYLSWRVLIPCFFVSTALLLSFQIFAVRIILNPMYTTIRIITAMTCLLSFFGLLYKGLFELCTHFYIRAKERHNTLKQQEKVREQIRSLSQQERIVFEYVQNGNDCGVWVSETDAAVQTLLYKGLLERIGDKSCFADWPSNTDERAVCILTVIPEQVKNILHKTER